MKFAVLSAAFAISTAFGAAAVAAEGFAAPTGEPVLTVSGDIAVSNVGDDLILDLDAIRSMGETAFSTTTPWTEGPQAFTGVSLADFVEAIGVTGGALTMTAINDYSVEVPVSDAVEGGPIIAYLLNGEEMSVRDKGPLWIVYPYDASEEYQSETTYSRSIWQLDRIRVQQ